jgi:hypothetical protein
MQLFQRIASALNAGDLIEWRPVRPLPRQMRQILVSRMAHTVLTGQDSSRGFPAAAADAVMGRFMAGHFVTVSRKSAEGVDLEQLEDVHEVWALCFRIPRPGWRLLGRFADRDTFIGLHPYDRIVLDGRPTYTGYARSIIEEWRVIFGDAQPLTGPNTSAYLTGVYRDVDQIN